MVQSRVAEYKPRTELRPSGLDGISDDQIGVHWALYEGYVNNTNTLNKEVAELVKNGNAVGTNPHFAELNRRKGFEYNGMVLHEYYFEAMKPTTGDAPSKVKNALESTFGSFDNWKTEFTAVAKQRGVGWAALYQDPLTRVLSNHWIDMHETGHPAGYKLILILDVWEHAFAVDRKPNPAGRAEYIDAYFKNVDWQAAANRLL